MVLVNLRAIYLTSNLQIKFIIQLINKPFIALSPIQSNFWDTDLFLNCVRLFKANMNVGECRMSVDELVTI